MDKNKTLDVLDKLIDKTKGMSPEEFEKKEGETLKREELGEEYQSVLLGKWEKVKDIDFIKWMCEKAEGFEWVKTSCNFGLDVNGDFIYHPIVLCPDRRERLLDGTTYDDCMIYFLLLQLAIEGVNRKSRESKQSFSVTSNHSFIEVYDWRWMRQGFMVYYKDCESLNQAKESALKYIYEQEDANA